MTDHGYDELSGIRIWGRRDGVSVLSRDQILLNRRANCSSWGVDKENQWGLYRCKKDICQCKRNV